MSILVFYVLLFGIFTMLTAQYIEQYRRAYKMWIFLIAYNGHRDLDNSQKKNYCSEIESYAREICELADMLHTIILLLFGTGIITIYVAKTNLPLVDEINSNILKGSILLTIILIFTVIPIFYFAKLNIIDKKRTSFLDEKIFSTWYRSGCHKCKEKEFIEKFKPDVLFDIFYEKVENGKIKPTKEEKEFLEKYRPSKQNLNP